MRSDRRSAYECLSLDLESALLREHDHGLSALTAETVEGATRFAAGAGRHGRFE